MTDYPELQAEIERQREELARIQAALAELIGIVQDVQRAVLDSLHKQDETNGDVKPLAKPHNV